MQEVVSSVGVEIVLHFRSQLGFQSGRFGLIFGLLEISLTSQFFLLLSYLLFLIPDSSFLFAQPSFLLQLACA